MPYYIYYNNNNNNNNSNNNNCEREKRKWKHEKKNEHIGKIFFLKSSLVNYDMKKWQQQK